MNLWGIVGGLIVAAECFLHLYGMLLSVNYMGERDREGDITYFQFVMLLLCTVGFAVMTKNINFKLLSDVIGIASFTLFSILGFITLVCLGLNMYRKANKNNAKGSVLVAVLVAVYVVLSVFMPDRENIGYSAEPEHPDPEDFLSEYVTDDYHDGYEDGLGDGYDTGYEDGYSDAYAFGYADGHSEAEGHSETYYELLRQAYQATGGSGSAFSRDNAGNVYVEETTPNGQKVKVPFTP